jgi:hypothetical protein
MHFLHVQIAAAKEREKAAQKPGTSSKPATKAGTTTAQKKGATPAKAKAPAAQSQKDLDIAGMNLNSKEEEQVVELPPKIAMAREKLLEEVAKTITAQQKDSPAISLVVIGELSDCVNYLRALIPPQDTWMQVNLHLWDAYSTSSDVLKRRRRSRTSEPARSSVRAASAGHGSSTAPKKSASGLHPVNFTAAFFDMAS